jgi:hypothetical protein
VPRARLAVLLKHFSQIDDGQEPCRVVYPLSEVLLLLTRSSSDAVLKVGWALWPDRHDLIAIDGKTSRRTHDKRKELKALHTLSAYATNARLVLAQLSVPEKTNETTAIPNSSIIWPQPVSSRERS